MSLTLLFVLLIVYQLKHFFADYPLQGKYMLGKFKDGWDWVLPLLAHVTVHGLFTLLICLVVRPELWWLSLVDMGIHFTMDRLKAGKKYLGRFKALSGKEFMAIMPDLEAAMKHNKNADWMLGIPSAERLSPLWAEVLEKARSNTYFWWALGLDQMVHHLTHYFIIWMLVV